MSTDPSIGVSSPDDFKKHLLKNTKMLLEESEPDTILPSQSISVTEKENTTIEIRSYQNQDVKQPEDQKSDGIELHEEELEDGELNEDKKTKLSKLQECDSGKCSLHAKVFIVKVPKGLASVVIGNEGSMLKEIRQKSGVKCIDFSQKFSNVPDLLIEGGMIEVKCAERLVNNILVNEYCQQPLEPGRWRCTPSQGPMYNDTALKVSDLREKLELREQKITGEGVINRAIERSESRKRKDKIYKRYKRSMNRECRQSKEKTPNWENISSSGSDFDNLDISEINATMSRSKVKNSCSPTNRNKRYRSREKSESCKKKRRNSSNSQNTMRMSSRWEMSSGEQRTGVNSNRSLSPQWSPISSSPSPPPLRPTRQDSSSLQASTSTQHRQDTHISCI